MREAEVRIAQGETAGKICRGAGISEQTYYKWRREYGGLNGCEAVASTLTALFGAIPSIPSRNSFGAVAEGVTDAGPSTMSGGSDCLRSAQPRRKGHRQPGRSIGDASGARTRNVLRCHTRRRSGTTVSVEQGQFDIDGAAECPDAGAHETRQETLFTGVRN